MRFAPTLAFTFLSLPLALTSFGCGDDDGAGQCDEPRCSQGTDGVGDGDGDGDGGLVGCVADRSCTIDFVSVDGLEGDMAGSGAWTVVDVRDPAEFAASHLPGALNLPQSALRTTVDGISGQVVDASTAESIFASSGLEPDDDVVLYEAENGTAAARVAWTLQYYGHAGGIRLLDGGLTAWNTAGYPTEALATAPNSGYTIAGVVDPLRVDKAWVNSHLDDANVVFIDARTAAEFDGGHIPGALNVDWQSNLAGDGSFLPSGQLETLYPAGDAQTTWVTYCQTGSRASVDYAVLRNLGKVDVRIYDGSWAEWGADPDTPKE